MIDLALDPASRDMVFRAGDKGLNLTALDGAARVGQSIGIRLRTWRGEWFLDNAHGVPYLEEILGKVRQAEIIEAILRAQILDVQSVQAVETFALGLNPQTRAATVEFSARSLEGLVKASLTVG
jgi:hypothetical protein